MCQERQIEDKQVDNATNEQYNQLLEQLQTELNDLLSTTTYLQEESDRLADEARKLIEENIQVRIEARLLQDKYRSCIIGRKHCSFQQLKHQIKHQRKCFSTFERRLRKKYEQPFHRIVSNTTPIKQSCRRIRSIPSESID